MLERLRIQNFKSWQDTGDMAFGSLTGFFGTNSSGKSSILQFLLMLKQTVESSDRSRVLHLGDDKSYVDLGAMHSILHDQQKELLFDIDWKRVSSIRGLKNSYIYAPTEAFIAEICSVNDTAFLKKFSYIADESTFAFKRINDNLSLPAFMLDIERVFKQYKYVYKSGPLLSPDYFLGVPEELNVDEPTYFYYDFPTLRQTESSLYNLLTQIYYLGPFRETPKRMYFWKSWLANKPHNVGNRGEHCINALLYSYENGSHIVERQVINCMKQLGLIYSFEIRPTHQYARGEYEIYVQITANSTKVLLAEAGFGVSQILPVLVLLFYVPEGSTVILEQPEIHLHPAVQAGLADVFIDAIKRRKVQIILESHSEHLLQRLQRRIAEEIISQEEIKLYFTSIEEGRSKLTTLEL